MIADDSRKPLDLQGDSLTIIQLPFNSGLSYGLNQALERVDTPYVMRMDDDELLTVRTRLGKQVEFLERYSEIDIVGFCVLTAIRCQNPDEAAFVVRKDFARVDYIMDGMEHLAESNIQIIGGILNGV